MLAVSLKKHAALTQAITILTGVCLMVLGSKISIPMYYVPHTLQTASMLVIAMTFTPSAAFWSLLSWLMLSVTGLPVLAGLTSGIAKLMGPTSGYLWGMLIAVTIMSACQYAYAGFFNRLFSKKTPTRSTQLSMPAMILVASIGIVIVLGLGWANLALYIGAWNAWINGVAPFIIGEFLKIIAVSGVISALRFGKVI